MIPCVCVDDSMKPDVIPSYLWVKKGVEYNITWIKYHGAQGIKGVELKELKLDEGCMPFNSYALRRFAIKKDDLQLFLELLKICSGKSLDINEILKEDNVYENT